MRNNWFLFMDLDGGSPYIFPTDPLVSHGFRGHLFSQITSFVDNSLYQSRNFYVPGSVALQEAFNCVSKFAGALFFWFSSGSNIRHELPGNSHGSKSGTYKSSSHVKHITSSRQNLRGFSFSSGSNGGCSTPVILGKVMSSTIRRLFKEADQLQSLPVLSLAAALVPPFDNLTPNVLALPVENTNIQMHGCMDQMPCDVERQGCAGLTFPDLDWRKHAIEPRTGIEFPMILDNIFSEDNSSSFTSEVLVGTGSRTMKIVKIKSLRVYAFGFYIHPYSVCEKLGPKYSSIPTSELNKCREFYQDLLREDISMTVRLVVNCSGMKINSVKDPEVYWAGLAQQAQLVCRARFQFPWFSAFEKSLRARLLKTNPDTDCNCITTFGSYFTQDIPLPVGTVIDFRGTADGRLITEIGGNQIGAVHSKDLCRAFFDMYIGDVPVSEQTKEEIGRNVASMMRRC